MYFGGSTFAEITNGCRRGCHVEQCRVSSRIKNYKLIKLLLDIGLNWNWFDGEAIAALLDRVKWPKTGGRVAYCVWLFFFFFFPPTLLPLFRHPVSRIGRTPVPDGKSPLKISYGMRTFPAQCMKGCATHVHEHVSNSDECQPIQKWNGIPLKYWPVCAHCRSGQCRARFCFGNPTNVSSSASVSYKIYLTAVSRSYFPRLKFNSFKNMLSFF